MRYRISGIRKWVAQARKGFVQQKCDLARSNGLQEQTEAIFNSALRYRFPQDRFYFSVTRGLITEICYISVMAKSLNIKNEEAATLAAELTALTGKGTTELILELLRREAAERHKSLDLNQRRRRIDSILSRARKKMTRKPPASGRVPKYDGNGLPE